MTERLELDLACSSEGLRELMEKLVEFSLRTKLPEQVFLDARLALDETVSNLLKYGGAEQGERRFQVRCAVVGSHLEIEVVDDSPPFDPLSVTAPQTGIPLQEREIGGLGIHLVRQLMDSVQWERKDTRNHLLLRRRLA